MNAETFLSDFSLWASGNGADCSEAADREARLSLLDTLACMLAGANQTQTLKAGAALRAAGASGVVTTVLGRDGFCAPAAALINGVAAHCLDFDDYEAPASTHPSAVLLPALLAVAELRPAALGDLTRSYALGYEAIVRMGRALGGYSHYEAGWHATASIGPIGAAAAVAALLDLAPARMTDAMALATSLCAGLKAQFGSDAKPLHAGFAARAGIEAALFAEAGLSANAAVLAGPYGFLARYGGGTAAAFRPFEGAGRLAIETDRPLRKPWPSCAYTHRAIEATLKLHHDDGLRADEITAGRIRVPEPFARVAGFVAPDNAAEARFSLTYCVATALLDGAVSPASFKPATMARPGLRDLMARLAVEAYEPGPGLCDMSPAAPDSVILEHRERGTFSQTVAEVKGGPANPLDEADIRAKFEACGGTADLANRLLSGPKDQPFSLRLAVV